MQGFCLCAKPVADVIYAAEGLRDQSQYEVGRNGKVERAQSVSFPAGFLVSLWVVMHGHNQTVTLPCTIFMHVIEEGNQLKWRSDKKILLLAGS